MSKRETGIAYLLVFLGGPLGLHKFYLNQVGWGLAYLFTGGFFFVGVLVDLFTLPSQVDRCNWELGWRHARDPWRPGNAFDEPDHERRAALREAELRLQGFDRRLINLEAVIHAKRY